MKVTWKKPTTEELSPYQRSYIDQVPGDDVISILSTSRDANSIFFNNIPKEKLSYRYAEGKWSIPQILVHIIDTERIFAYRILCISRGDKTPFPGYEENEYAAASNADEREFSDIIEEYINVRTATLSLLKSLDEKMLLQKGTANNMPATPLLFTYMLAGHELHHIKVITEKYF
jgi:uncharacterized damage-inducible protein DinB